MSNWILVFSFLVNLSQFYRQRAVETEYDLLGMKRIVIVLVVPVHSPNRRITVLDEFGEPGQCLDHRLAYLRVVGMKSPVRSDQILAVIGDQMCVERGNRIHPVRADLHAEGIDVTHSLAAQLGLHRQEEIDKG